MTPLLLIGGGGHCRSCVDVIESTGAYEIVGIVERPNGPVEPVFGYAVVGDDRDLAELLHRSSTALITVGQLKTPKLRMRIFEMVRRAGGSLAVVVSPNSHVPKHSELGDGSIVMHDATVNAGARVGVNCIINSHALVEHGVVIGSHTHISTGALINGGVKIGDGTFVGSGAIVNHGVNVGAGCVIASGSIILSDVLPGTQVLGGCR